jgi:hypothetical protein
LTSKQKSVVQVLNPTAPDFVREDTSKASEKLKALDFTEINVQDASDEERTTLLVTNCCCGEI